MARWYCMYVHKTLMYGRVIFVKNQIKPSVVMGITVAVEVLIFVGGNFHDC